MKTFNTILLADMGEIKIYSATMKDVEVENVSPVMLLEDAVKQEKEFEEEGDFADVGKRQNQYANEDELEELNRDTKQRNFNAVGKETEDNCEDKCKEGRYRKSLPTYPIKSLLSASLLANCL